MRGVAGHAEGLALDQVGAGAGAGVGQRALGGGVNREHVVAVHDLGRHVVSGTAIGHIGARHLGTEGRGVGVLIVVADEDHRQLLDGGEVHALMPGAPAGGAVAEIAEGHAVLALVAERQSGAGSHGNGGGQGADDGDQAQLQIAHVHVPLAAAREAVHAAHVLGEDAAGGDAANQEHGHVAVGGQEDVVRSGQQGGADGDGFLAASHIHAAQDFTLPVEFAFDAVFHFPHHGHVVQAFVSQLRTFAELAVKVRNSGVYRAHRDPLASVTATE